MDSKLFQKKNGPKLAKKKDFENWKPNRPYIHMPGYVTVEEFLSLFERGLRSHFAKSSLFNQEDDTFHIEDLSYSAEFYAENFAMIMSAIDWKENKNAR
jgi:hypothetical protein